LVTTMLGQLPAVLSSVSEMPEVSEVFIMDLPFTVDAEKSYKAIKAMSEKGVRITIIDHHLSEANVRFLERLKREGLAEIRLFESAWDMNEHVLRLVEKEAELSTKDRAIIMAGAVTDLDCKALREANVYVRKTALAVDMAIYKYGDGALAYLLTKDWGSLLLEGISWSKEHLKADEVLKAGRMRSSVLLLPLNFKVPMVNKAVAQVIASGKAKYVLLPVNGVNPRSGKWSTALMVYAHPCENVMDLVRSVLPNAKVVGHKSFAIAILNEGAELSDEKAERMLRKAAERVIEALTARSR